MHGPHALLSVCTIAVEERHLACRLVYGPTLRLLRCYFSAALPVACAVDFTLPVRLTMLEQWTESETLSHLSAERTQGLPPTMRRQFPAKHAIVVLRVRHLQVVDTCRARGPSDAIFHLRNTCSLLSCLGPKTTRH